MRKTSFSLTRCKVHGAVRHCVTYPRPDGPGRIRRFFEEKSEAKTFLELKKQEAAAHGVKAFALSEQDRADWLWACAQLAPYGLNVRKAVETLLPQLKAREHGLSAEEAVARLIESKTKAGLSERHLYTLKNRLTRFAQDFPERALASFTLSDVETWLGGLPVGAQSVNHYKAALHSLFAHGVKLGACLANPVSGIDSRKVVRGAPAILTAAQLSALLTGCAEDDEMQAYIAIGAFAGLRSAEIERIRWEDINLVRGFLTVGALNAKTARRRLVPICPALAAWLTPLAKPEGAVAPASNFRRRFYAARKAAGLADKWEGNELRHSYATYRLAETQDAARTALEMGNSPAILLAHYRELVGPEDAAKWFAVKPEAAANVVSIAA
jgi:integrase